MWYDPKSSYGAHQSYEGSPWQSTYLDTTPEAAWVRWGAANGIPQNDSTFGRWFRSQFARSQEGYSAAVGTNGNLLYQQYLGGIDPNALRSQFEQQSASARGENRRALAPVSRWQNRG